MTVKTMNWDDNHTQWALREAPNASPRETRNGRNPAASSDRGSLGEHARCKRADGTGDSSHFEYKVEGD